jgi:hypothetical protein
VNVNGDRKVEQNEAFSLQLSNATNATISKNTGMGTILNEDNAKNSDFNGDGYNDIVWRNYATGDTEIWLMNGTLQTSTLYLPNVSTNWVIDGVGDFNGDGNPDLLWRDYSSGLIGFWLMQGNSIIDTALLEPVGGGWAIEGVGDFNGDGKLDIVWRDYSSGANAIWLMNGVTYSTYILLPTVGTNWVLEGVADLNGDGQSDLIWRDSVTGTTGTWLIYGTGGVLFFSGLILPSPTGSNWSLEATNDYNQDGKADLIWRDLSTGWTNLWLMNGATKLGEVPLNNRNSAWWGI